MIFHVVLPFPPSVNTYWRRSGTHMHISKKGQEYRAKVLSILAALKTPPAFGSKPVAVSVRLCRGDRRRYDLDNFFKAVFDAFTHGGVWDDDSQIDMLSVFRGPVDPAKQGYAEITISEAS